MTPRQWTSVAFVVSLLGCTAPLCAGAAGREVMGGEQMLTWEQVAARALQELSDGERRGAAVYLDEVEMAPGSTLKVEQKEVPVRRVSAMVFVDREPQVNWGHSCRYMLIGLEDGTVTSFEAQFPPFLRGVPKSLRMIWKGDSVPDWAIAKP